MTPQQHDTPVEPTGFQGDAQVADRPSRRTRTSAAWLGVMASSLVLVLLLIFILQNRRSVRISFLGAAGKMPLGVALLFAVIGGILLAGVVGSLRIWQLRHRRARPVVVANAAARGGDTPAALDPLDAHSES